MHELVREFAASLGPQVVLAQMPLDGGALVAGFAPAGPVRLRWIAKTAYGEAACGRLHAEVEALQRLEPLAEELRIPQVLAWRQSGSGAEAVACVVQSAIAGLPIGRRRQAASPAALAWLRRFQDLQTHRLGTGPLPTLAVLAEAIRSNAAAYAQETPELAPLLQWVVLVLANFAIAEVQSVWCHGDFWAGNILWAEPRRWRRSSGPLGVVDWSSLGPGSALDDALNWLVHEEPNQPWVPRLLRRPRELQLLRAWAERAGYAPAAAHFAFYLFLARRLLWELGYALQARSASERAQACVQWGEIIRWLNEKGLPSPFAEGSA